MAIVSKGTTLEISTGTGGADTITGVSLGAITEVTAVAHGNAAGDVGTFAAIAGTTELNATTAMILAVETDAMFFDIDSSGYSAYTSGGTFTPVTYTAVGDVVDFDGPGGSAAVIDVTNLASTAREKLLGIPDEGQLSVTLNWDISDAGQLAARAAHENQTLKTFRLTYSDGTIQTFSGYVMSFPSSGGVDAKVVGNMTIEITGLVVTT